MHELETHCSLFLLHVTLLSDMAYCVQFCVGYFLDLESYAKVKLKDSALARAKNILYQRQWDMVLSSMTEDLCKGALPLLFLLLYMSTSPTCSSCYQ